jgi:hypothetical protein
MTDDSHWQIMLQSLGEWLTSLTGILQLLAIVFAPISIGLLFISYRWIRRGGMKRQSTTNFFCDRQIAEQFCRNPTDRA